MSNVTVTTIFDNCRAALPGVADNIIQMELYNTVDELCREALRIAAPVNPDLVTLDPWLPTAQWVPNFQVLLHGTLYRLFTQPGKPYSSGELAKAHSEMYGRYLSLARAENAGETPPTTTYQRILFNVRTQMPMARDATVELEAYNVANKIRLEALMIAPLTSTATNPETFLPNWSVCYGAALHGILSAMYSQANQPWSKPDFAKAHHALYLEELLRIRADNANTITEPYWRVVSNVRALMPLTRDVTINHEIFNITDQIRREALRLPPLYGIGSIQPANYFPSEEIWAQCYQATLNGTIYALYAQANQPWAKPDLAKQYYLLYMADLDRLRSQFAADPISTYERLLFNLRTQMPLVRDETIELELYTCIDKIRREALRLPPLDAGDTDPDEFLPDPETWAQCYQVILHCALYALYGQANKEWSKPDFAKLHYALYQQELEKIRTEEASDPETILTRLIDNARIHLPGAQDATLRLELFNTLDEFCNQSLVWQEGIDFNAVPDKLDYYLVPGEPGKIIRLMYIITGESTPIYGSMQVIGDLILRSSPNGLETYTAVVAKSVTDPTDRDGYPEIARWILERYHNDILEGLLYRMMMQPAKPYTNEKLSVYHMRKFRGACANARTDMMRKNVYRAQAWRFPRFAVN